MNYKFSVFLFLISFFLRPALFAQSGEYKFTRVNYNQGLSHSQINCILKDSKGFMWFGTMTGLNRYDGYTFKTFRHDIRDSTSINNNFISNIMEGPDQRLLVDGYYGLNVYNPYTEKFDTKAALYLQKYGVPDADVNKIIQARNKNFWFLHGSKGLFVYNTRQQNTRQVVNSRRDTLSIHSNRIADFAEDKQGNFWLIHTDGVLEKLNGKTFQVMFRSSFIQKNLGRNNRSYAVFIDADGEPWIYIPNGAQGVYYLDTARQAFTHFNRESGQVKLNTNIVKSVTQDDQNLIWIGTDHGGINLINKKTSKIKYLLHNPEDEKSLSQNSIYALYKDNSGIIWVGTYKGGINYYHRDLNKFELYQQQRDNAFSLPFNDVNRFVEDAKGNLWIGTNGGGLIYFDRSTGKFRQFLHNPQDPGSLSNNIIVGLYLDRDQKLWVGTYFGGLNIYDGEKFIHYRHNPADPNSLVDDRVWEMFEDSQQNMWVGTMGGGLELFDRKTSTFKHHRPGQPNSVNSDYIFFLTEDREQNLWIATAYGANKLDLKTGRFQHYVNNNKDPEGLSNNNLTSVIQDSRGLLWMATNEGLNLFDKEKGTFRIFRKENGLADNSILSLLEDNQHNIWLSTPNGLTCLNINKNRTGAYTFKFKNYDESDGLQGKVFNTNAALKTSRGELLFGGANGFNLVIPENIKVNRSIPNLLFTDFQVFNESLGVGDKLDKRVILDSAIFETKEITLPYHQNMFSVSFAALSFLQPEKNQYAYILEGFNNKWLAATNELRKATFTNLDPGTYTLRVRASNNDGIWNQEGISLKITILPPFWKTKLAIVLYVLLVLMALWLARHLMLERERLKFRIVQERQEARRLHEMDVMKIKFFTNVSHEFRTPLTLILTPLEKIIKSTAESDQKNHLLLIHRNARRLLNMVNQLLDFRKMEVQEIALHPTKAEIVQFIKEIVFSFSDLSEKKNIKFSFITRIEELETFFDQDKLEKILFNLLSNAFKFTPEDGTITVELDMPGPDTMPGRKNLRIKVIDTGIGIPLENQEKIFKRFFQSDIPGSMVNQGSGIGLAITKKFVKLHGGSIGVQSQPGAGSCFTVLLPVAQSAAIIPNRQPEGEEIQIIKPASQPAGQLALPLARNTKKPLVLLIEDNEDFRFYLKDNLQGLYQVLEAANGKQGWQLALAHLPDLVVSDIMMPEMDGITLNRKLKRDSRTAHIPIILLTANATEEQRLAGYENGANAYITKPFNFEILLSRMKNLISQQEAYRQAMVPKMEVKPQDIQITSLDDKLIRKAVAYTEKNISNPEFSVEELSREMGMSRVYLYKKLLALTGKAPLEFIRTVRLKRAAQLLLESQLTVAEVAYEVGFNNPKYFTKYFKTQFNCLPSAYAALKKSEANAAEVPN